MSDQPNSEQLIERLSLNEVLEVVRSRDSEPRIEHVAKPSSFETVPASSRRGKAEPPMTTACATQMSARISQLAHNVPADSYWRRLAAEVGLTWQEANEMTFADFAARLCDARATRKQNASGMRVE